jgi:hypothetical protein
MRKKGQRKEERGDTFFRSAFPGLGMPVLQKESIIISDEARAGTLKGLVGSYVQNISI